MPSESSNETQVPVRRSPRRPSRVVLPATHDPATTKNVDIKVNVNVDIKLHWIIWASAPIITAILAYSTIH